MNQFKHFLFQTVFNSGSDLFFCISFYCSIIFRCPATGTPALGDSIQLSCCSCCGSYRIIASRRLSLFFLFQLSILLDMSSFLLFTFRDLVVLNSLLDWISFYWIYCMGLYLDVFYSSHILLQLDFIYINVIHGICWYSFLYWLVAR